MKHYRYVKKNITPIIFGEGPLFFDEVREGGGAGGSFLAHEIFSLAGNSLWRNFFGNCPTLPPQKIMIRPLVISVGALSTPARVAAGPGCSPGLLQ